MGNGTKQTGWLIPDIVHERFTAYTAQVGLKTQDAASAALLIFCQMPPQIQQAAILESKGVGQMDEVFWEQFRKGYELAQLALQDTQKQKPDVQ